MKKILNYLLQGLLLTAPFAITFYIIYYLFAVIDGLLRDNILKYYNIDFPGLGLLIIVILLIITGMLGQSIIGKPIVRMLNNLINRVPLLKVVYSAFSDLFSAFVGKEKKFNRPVRVIFDENTGMERLGFLTEEDLGRLNEKDKVAVYFPFSYSFAGNLYIVKSKYVERLDINPAEVMKFIVSAGVSGWELEEKSPAKTDGA